MLAQLLDDLVGLGPIQPLARLFGDCHSLQNQLFGLLAKPLEPSNLSGFARSFELFEREDIELLVKRGRFFGTNSRQPQKRKDTFLALVAAQDRYSECVFSSPNVDVQCC